MPLCRRDMDRRRGQGCGDHHQWPPDQPLSIVAEMSGNHDSNLGRAIAILQAAAGANAVKLQTYAADTVTLDHDDPDFAPQGGLWAG